MKKTLVLAGLAVLSSAAFAQQSPIVNEFVFDHTGTDTGEFVEIFASANFNLANFQIIGIEGDGTGAGTVDNVFQPGTTDANGFWTTNFLSNILENGTLTLLLVTGFTGAVGNDLDTNDDGVFDSTPWSQIFDGIGVTDLGATDFNYSNVVLLPSMDPVNLRVGGASRIPNGTDTNTVGDWMRNDFDGAGLPGLTGTPTVGEAWNTPNAVNAQVVPEPATMAVLGMGALVLLRRRKK